MPERVNPANQTPPPPPKNTHTPKTRNKHTNSRPPAATFLRIPPPLQPLLRSAPGRRGQRRRRRRRPAVGARRGLPVVCVLWYGDETMHTTRTGVFIHTDTSTQIHIHANNNNQQINKIQHTCSSSGVICPRLGTGPRRVGSAASSAARISSILRLLCGGGLVGSGVCEHRVPTNIDHDPYIYTTTRPHIYILYVLYLYINI